MLGSGRGKRSWVVSGRSFSLEGGGGHGLSGERVRLGVDGRRLLVWCEGWRWRFLSQSFAFTSLGVSARSRLD